MLNLTPNPLLQLKQLTAGGAEAEMCRLPHLLADRKHVTRGIRRNFRDVRKVQDAAQVLDRIPAFDEAFHLAISGRFSLWHLVPAVLRLVPCIDSLTIATLGFSKRNIASICELIDTDRIRGGVRLLASHYFKSTSPEIYEFAKVELGKRELYADFLSLRTHAKLLLIKIDSGRTITVESSANLRSCKNIEQMSIFGDPALYLFHTGWIDELFARGSDAR